MDERPDPDFQWRPLEPDPSPTKPLSLLPTEGESPGIDLKNVVRLLYCHNPFYCISAVFVLWGLVKSFHAHGGGLQGTTSRPELLMGGFAGYALLLGAVGWLLIRAGQLWEDIRTILLLIVIIFLACSMSFDEVLTTDPASGQLYYLGGLAFAVILSEVVMHSIRLRLPMFYRLPYYASLALFFLYPLLLGQWLGSEDDPQLLWRLAGFAPLAGLVTLTLLPAVRRGASYVRINGSPWQWPWYPWPLFVVLLIGVAMRSYTLCVSFHPSRGPATIFEPFFLVPLLLAVNVLLLEVGIHARRKRLLRAIMAAPLGLLLVSAWTIAGIPASISVRPLLMHTLGCTPLFLTLVAVTGFYAVALLRRVPHAMHWLTVALALFVVIGPATAQLPASISPKAWPLLAVAVLQLVAALRYRSALYWLLAASCAIAAVCINWPAEVAMRWHGAVPVHLMLISMLLIGSLLGDVVARVSQRVAFAGVVLASAWVIVGQADGWPDIRREVLMIYPGVMFLVALGYGYWVGNRWYRATAAMILAAWSVALGRNGYGSLRISVAGLDEIALGMACLLVGLTVSLWKIGLPQAWWNNDLGERLRDLFGPAAIPVPPPIDSGGKD